MATAAQRLLVRRIVPEWGPAPDADIDIRLDQGAALVSSAVYGDHYDRAVCLAAARDAQSLPVERRQALAADLATLTASRSSRVPFVVL